MDLNFDLDEAWEALESDKENNGGNNGINDLAWPVVAGGNTRLSPQPKAKSTSRPAIWWKIVLGIHDSYSHSDLVAIVAKISSKWIYQEECSPEGFKHYQMLIQLKKKTTIGQVIKFFSPLHGAKNVQAKTSDKDFWPYCSKEETRVSGPWVHGFPEYREPVKVISKEEMYPWQSEVVSIVEGPVNDRLVYWYYDTKGGAGKTALVKYLCVKHDAFLFNGKASDIASRIIVTGVPPKLAVMNLARSQENYISYQGIEEVKDGMVASGKYEGGQCCFNSPHVIVVANFKPDETKLSEDRWKIVNVGPEELYPIFEL